MIAKIKLLRDIFFTFLKISPSTFGGGYAMLALIEAEVVRKHRWITEEDIVDIFTVAQSVPGAVAINSAIFVGYRISGVVGAIIAMLGIVLPTLIIVIIVSFFYHAFQHNPIVKSAFNGIGAAVIALILQAAYTIGKTSLIDLTTWILAIISIIVLLFLTINPIFIIIFGIIVGLGISKIKKIKRGHRKLNKMN